MADKDKPWLDMPIIRAAPSTEAVSEPEAEPHYTGADTDPPPSLADYSGVSLPSLTGMRDKLQEADMAALTALQPGPDAGVVERFGRRAAQVGVHGLASLAQFPLNALIGATEGPVQGATINPETGTLGITPEAMAFGTMFASPLRIGPRGPVPNALAAREAPLSPEFRAAPMAAPAAAKIAEPPAAPVSATGVPVTPPAAPTTVAPTTSGVPKTAAEAKSVASAYYKIADEAGGAELPAQFADDLIGTVKGIAPQSEAGRIFAGETEVTRLANRVEELRGKPISLAAAQDIDEALGGLIDKEYTVKGLTKDGNALYELQTTFRDMVENAASGEAGAGADALKQGRAAWAQAQKMADLERIWTRAQLQDYPSTGVRAGIRSLLANERRVRGYSAEERDALKQAAERGVIGGALHVFGSRLIPQAATVGGFFGSGPVGAVVAGAVTHAATSGVRAGATALQKGRMEDALGVLGRRVPPMPRNDIGP